MSYQVLARKFRPQRFAEVVGQKHVTRTLQNAIKEDRVGHAYLFVGSRGIGKTTSARIFAKALNCENPEVAADGTIEPCCGCRTCEEIAAGGCLDVVEIDGASHNGVDDIRELRETVQYAPTNGRRFKLYIIDEVHMLTTQAWNALLKTLEEPPSHVKFLFATTEPHKILPTILSRCQRFDLKRIPVPIIVEQLRRIAETENVHIDDGALTIIARTAEGSMRDAQSVFDQMIAFCGGSDADSTITEAHVIDVFGLASHSELLRLVQALLMDNTSEVIVTVHNLADKSRDLERLYADLLLYLRNLMVFDHVDEPAQVLDLSESALQDLSALAGQSKSTAAQRLAEGMLANAGGIRDTLNKRIFIEVTLLRVMRDAHSQEIDDLITQLRRLGEAGDLPGSVPRASGAVRSPSAAAPAQSDVSPGADQGDAGESPPTAADRAGAAACGDDEGKPSRSEPTLGLFDSIANPGTDASAGQSESPAVNSDDISAAAKHAAPERPAAANAPTGAASKSCTEAVPVEPETPQAPTQPGNTRCLNSTPEIWQSLEQNNLVKSVCKMFEGEIRDVRG